MADTDKTIQDLKAAGHQVAKQEVVDKIASEHLILQVAENAKAIQEIRLEAEAAKRAIREASDIAVSVIGQAAAAAKLTIDSAAVAAKIALDAASTASAVAATATKLALDSAKEARRNKGV